MDVIASGSSSASTASIDNRQQRKQTFNALSSALTSGDLSAAKSAYANLVGNATPPQGSPLAALGQALQSGDIGAAQKADATIAAHRGGHHRGHKPEAAPAISTVSSAAPASTDPTKGKIVSLLA
jgi:hypothetical protein